MKESISGELQGLAKSQEHAAIAVMHGVKSVRASAALTVHIQFRALPARVGPLALGRSHCTVPCCLSVLPMQLHQTCERAGSLHCEMAVFLISALWNFLGEAGTSAF